MHCYQAFLCYWDGYHLKKYSEPYSAQMVLATLRACNISACNISNAWASNWITSAILNAGRCVLGLFALMNTTFLLSKQL